MRHFNVEYIPKPCENKWKDIANEFEKSVHFPHCLGAVGGKHIHVNKCFKSGSMNLNYKNHFSIVLMAVVDSNYKFIYADIGYIKIHSVIVMIYQFLMKLFLGNC